MHGKGLETLPNGQSYMVITENGKKMEYITMGKDPDYKFFMDRDQNNSNKDIEGKSFVSLQIGTRSDPHDQTQP
jgi:hypothetical protein